MNYCARCGKPIYENMQPYSINGNIVCEECAYTLNAMAATPPANAAPPAQHTYVAQGNAPQGNVQQGNAQNEIHGSANKNRWSKMLKIMGYICIVGGIIASVIGGILVIGTGSRIGMNTDSAILSGIGIIVLGTLVSILSPALLMCFAQMAEDIATIKEMLYHNQSKK